LFSFDPVYDDYLISINDTQAPSGNSKPNLSEFRSGLYIQEFHVSSSIIEVFFVRHIGHDIEAGTDMTFHVHWSHNNASPAGNVKWHIDYTIARGYEAGVFSVPTTLTSIQAAGAQYAHHITDDDDMVITTNVEIEPDSIVIGRIWRDTDEVDDTFADGAFLLHADIHYKKSRVGTTERNRPFTSGGF